MSRTKDLILETARRLFNEKGFTQITIRMIAEEMGISSGNLNYHFKKREDILETLYFEMVGTFDERVSNLPHTDFSLAQILGDITSSMVRMVEYRFIWTDLYHLLKQSSAIREHFEKAQKARIEGTKFMFTELKKNGVLNDPEFYEEHEQLVDRMINFSNTWLYSSGLYAGNVVDEVYIKKQAITLLSMMYPYFTAVGKQEYKLLLPL